MKLIILKDENGKNLEEMEKTILIIISVMKFF